MTFKPGVSGNQQGRPVAAVTRALRKIVEPEQLAQTLYTMANDRGIAPRDRLMALSMIYDRLEGKPVQSVAVDARVQSLTQALPAGWQSLSPSERHAFLDRVVADPSVLALSAGATDDEVES